jgi:hypothetical protein
MIVSKFFILYVRKLSLDDLAGLCTETVDIAILVINSLGQSLLLAKFNVLNTDVATLRSLMNKSRGSAITSQLKSIDESINVLFAEIKRTIKALETSSNTAKAEAATLLMSTVKPYWDITSKRYASQSAQLEELFNRVNANPELANALTTVDIITAWQQLVIANAEFNVLYDQRFSDQASSNSQAATSFKETVVKGYEDFCTVLEQTVTALPSPELEKLFNEVNEVRK